MAGLAQVRGVVIGVSVGVLFLLELHVVSESQTNGTAEVWFF